MPHLLDTHTFLWWVADEPTLSDRAAEVIRDPASEIFLSAVSAWEIGIKHRLGRDQVIRVDRDPEQLIPELVAANGFVWLPIEARHALRAASLPFHHRDPFDRLLVAQAQMEGLTIVSRDRAIAQYDVPIVW